jgi:ribosomal protein S18 acetylase RimI-like enzyme
MVKYRKATRKDSDKIFEYGNKYFKVGQYPYSLWNQKDLNKFLVKPDIAIVAEDEEELVGFVAAHANFTALPADHGYLEWCFVHPDYRRKGVWSELCRKIEMAFQELGKNYIVIDTTEDNAPMQKYLSKQGYELLVKDVFYKKSIS